MNLPLEKLLVSHNSLLDAYSNVVRGRISQTPGPVDVWVTDKGEHLLVDGHHRLVQHLLSGKHGGSVPARVVGQGYTDYWASPQPDDRARMDSKLQYGGIEHLTDDEGIEDGRKFGAALSHPVKLGKSQREKDARVVVSVIAFDGDGKILMGLRSDTGKWNLPGGHVEPGEDTYAAAKRELKEETGLDAEVFTRVGHCDVRDGLRVWTFTCHVSGEPDAGKDPDEEMSAFKWVTPSKMPKSIKDNLHNKKDVSLQFLGVQDGDLLLVYDEDDGGDHDGRRALTKLVKADLNELMERTRQVRQHIAKLAAQGPQNHTFPHRSGDGHVLVSQDPSKPGRWRATRIDNTGAPVGHVEAADHHGAIRAAYESGADVMKKSEDLAKGILGAAAGAALSLAQMTVPPKPVQASAVPVQAAPVAPAPTTPATQAWTPEGLHPDLHHIAQLESSGGQNVQHAAHSGGEYHTAVGAVGLKPRTAHEEWRKTKALQAHFPGLEDPAAFTQALKTNHQLYNLTASAHWARLKARFGSAHRAAFAWRWGWGNAAKAPDQQVEADPYVTKFRQLSAPQMASITKTETFEDQLAAWMELRKDQMQLPLNEVKQPNQSASDHKVHHTETPHFKKWFGDSKVLHPHTQKPLRVYHGTTHDFKSFNSKKGNQTNWFGRAHYFTDNHEDLGHNYATDSGPDLQGRIEMEAERMERDDEVYTFDEGQEEARKKLVGPAARTIPAYLKIRNPVVIKPQGGTYYHYEEHTDENGDPTGKVSGNGVKLINAIRRTARRYNAASQYPVIDENDMIGHLMEHVPLHEGASAHEIDKALRRYEPLYEIQDNDGTDLGMEFLRDIWRNAGHDGIIMDPSHFNMTGTKNGTNHYIVFSPMQIKSAIGNRGTYNPRSSDFSKEELNKTEGNLSEEELEEASEIALDMIGFNPQAHPAFTAAKFLTSGKDLPLAAIRQALYDQDSDYYGAALQAYGLEDTDANRKALKAIVNISGMHKAEDESKVPAGTDIEAGTAEGKDTVEELRRAFKAKQVRVAHLDGKHSKGSLIAKDDDTQNIYLLKPGSGGQSPASGASEEPASQSRREAAFWHMADAWGIGACVPKADLVLIDGTEYAAIRMLPFSYKNLEKKAYKDQGLARRALAPYRNNGILHKWAVMDFILGNPDRHGQNLMVSEDNDVVALIDHGSAFAGPHFDPAYDQNSFVPYYLRAWAPNRFNRMTVKQKLDQMPLVSSETKQELRDWLDSLHADRLEMVLHRYGIDARPSLDRLAKVKTLTSHGADVDEAINRLWITT